MKHILGLLIVFAGAISTILTNEITLEDHYKVINTFSGDIDKKDSFHIVVAKNKKTNKYELIPISFFNKVIKQHEGVGFNFTKEPRIESYHISEGSRVSFFIKLRDMDGVKRYIVDVDFINGKSNISKALTNDTIKAMIKLDDRQILVTKLFNELFFHQIFSSDIITSFVYSKSKNNKSFFKSMSMDEFGVVLTDELVKNGSIRQFKVYCENGVVYLTKDDIKKRESHVVGLRLNDYSNDNSIVELNTYSFDQFPLVMDLSSYFFKEKFYQLIFLDNALLLGINDVKTGLSKNININGNQDLIVPGEGFGSLENFMKNVTKGKYILTLTVNDHIDTNYLVLRFDYVLKETYTYNNCCCHINC